MALHVQWSPVTGRKKRGYSATVDGVGLLMVVPAEKWSRFWKVMVNGQLLASLWPDPVSAQAYAVNVATELLNRVS